MSLEEQFPNIPEDVVEYLMEQKMRERYLRAEKDYLKHRLDKLEEQLKLLEYREGGLTCMISTGNVYQVSTVRLVREGLSANLTSTLQTFFKVHRKWMRLQRNIRHEQSALYDSLVQDVPGSS